MATINRSFYNNENEYSDGAIEDEILEIVKNNDNFQSALKNEERWAVFYHLSHLRENILNWYPFDSEKNLLEIGAGCGALTGLFCEKLSKVTAVELTDKRAQIIYERHKNRQNLEIMVGNLNNMEFSEKFDYIILNGVLEYAKMFTNTEEPYKDFLHKIRSFLSEDGIILLGIENRLGLKYINGCKEDHLGQYFLGIDEYLGNDSVRTFSKKELVRLICDVGFENYKFYYPYPDYKFPETILTDESIEKCPYDSVIPNYDQTRVKFFNDEVFNLSLANEGISKYFSNSFLLELKNKEIVTESDDIWLSKISSNREEKYRIFTLIKNQKNELIVYKIPLSNESKDHIFKMAKVQKMYDSGKIKFLNSTLQDNCLKFPFLFSKTMKEILFDLAKKNDKDSFIKIIIDFYHELKNKSINCKNYHDKEFEDVFGGETCDNIDSCLKYPNIDLIFENIFIDNDTYMIIDYEWCFDFPIPVEFIIWRSISIFFYKYSILNNFININEIFEALDLDSEKISIFKIWDYNFVKNVKGEGFSNIGIPNKNIILLDNENIFYLQKILSENNKNKGVIGFYKDLNLLIANKDKTNQKLRNELKKIKKSNSWRLTKPLRLAISLFKNFLRN